jgi:hypothetical protein
MIDNFDLLLAEYLGALANNAVNAELRSRITEAVGHSYESVMKVADVIITHCKSRVADGISTVDEAIALARREYINNGFGSIAQYKYLAPIVVLYIDSGNVADYTDEEKAEKVRMIYDANVRNSNANMKRAINIYCLSAIMKYRVYPLVMDMLQDLVAVIDGYTREEKDRAVLPACIMESI